MKSQESREPSSDGRCKQLGQKENGRTSKDLPEPHVAGSISVARYCTTLKFKNGCVIAACLCPLLEHAGRTYARLGHFRIWTRTGPPDGIGLRAHDPEYGPNERPHVWFLDLAALGHSSVHSSQQGGANFYLV